MRHSATQHSDGNGNDVIEKRETRDRVAYHEAGHVVAALHLAIPVRQVRIDEAPDKNGRWSGMTKVDYVVNGAESFERTATYLWAGSIAERVHVTKKHIARPLISELEYSYGAVLDVTAIRRSAAELNITAWSRPSRRAAAKLVCDSWTEIERLAVRLDEEGTFVLTLAGSFKMGAKHFKSIEDALADRDGLMQKQWLLERMAEQVEHPHS